MIKIVRLRVLAILIGIAVCCVLFVACQSSTQKYMNSFEDFVCEVENDASNFSEKEWKQNDVEFDKYVNEKYENVADELSSSDKKKVGELTARYYKVRAKSYGESLMDAIEDGLNYIEGLANGILNDNNE